MSYRLLGVIEVCSVKEITQIADIILDARTNGLNDRSTVSLERDRLVCALTDKVSARLANQLHRASFQPHHEAGPRTS